MGKAAAQRSHHMDSATNPDEVTWITENVAITNFYSAHDKDVICQQKVQAILCLDRDLQGNTAQARGAKVIELVHLVDGANEMFTFKNAVATLERLIEKWERVIVHCRAGRSRSIAVVAAYLKRAKGLSAHEALALVCAKREAAIAPELARLVELIDE
jgi:atypical dual specificity phosphatase